MSIYPEYKREPSRQRQCMHYSEDSGIRCRATAMKNEIMCFQHRVDDIPTVLQNDPFDIEHLNDRGSIQRAVADTAARLACNHMDFKRAALLLQALQIASANLTAYEQVTARLAAQSGTAQTVPAKFAAAPAEAIEPGPSPDVLPEPDTLTLQAAAESAPTRTSNLEYNQQNPRRCRLQRTTYNEPRTTEENDHHPDSGSSHLRRCPPRPCL
jgi:hypothetical protein